MKTQANYLDSRDNCPNCDSDSLDRGPLEFAGGKALQFVLCLNCKTSWFDAYKLTGYELYQEGNKNP